MTFLKPVINKSNELTGYGHWCAGCRHVHVFNVAVPGKPKGNRPEWTFNGDMEKPTFTPSMRSFEWEKEGGGQRTLCHYFLTDGMIDYLGDSSDHELRGKHPLQPIPDGYGF